MDSRKDVFFAVKIASFYTPKKVKISQIFGLRENCRSIRTSTLEVHVENTHYKYSSSEPNESDIVNRQGVRN